jgi:hypothetical protein
MFPSIFTYATKELSQDAFFCWLLEWAWNKYEGKDLNVVANELIKQIIGFKINVDKKPLIKMQYKKIDFFVRLNDEITIIFEDKTRTEMHDEQLRKYKEIIENEYPNDELFFVYLKTDLLFPNEQEKVSNAGYKIIDIFSISDILNINIKNDIYKDYYKFISEKAKKYKNIESVGFSKWKQDEWIGFSYKLVRDLECYYNSGIWQGREFWIMFSELKWLYPQLSKETFCISLEIKHSIQTNKGRMCILLHIEKKRIPEYKLAKAKTGIIQKLNNIYADKNIITNNRAGKKQLEIGYFPDFPILKKGCDYIDYEESRKYLEIVIGKFNKKNIKL